jgi:hypothetical protein
MGERGGGEVLQPAAAAGLVAASVRWLTRVVKVV